MHTRRQLFGFLGILSTPNIANATRKEENDMITAADKFAQSYHKWCMSVTATSPFSIGYKRELKDFWDRYELEKNFDSLKGVINNV